MYYRSNIFIMVYILAIGYRYVDGPACCGTAAYHARVYGYGHYDNAPPHTAEYAITSNHCDITPLWYHITICHIIIDNMV